ncbi:MAG TPA: TetR/AcrR family transcriptional regulator, partial [Thermomicrobiales bacterium]|nr:TetR/AcrR family transcriptional regulator [Thermomicrobiales bacterium]
TANAVSNDPRVRRTRRMLRDAALELVAERDFSDITISEITRRADINRATFYQHYIDKDDLIAQALDSLFDEFTASDRSFVATGADFSRDVTPPPLIALFHHLSGRQELYRRLLGNGGSTAFARRHQAFWEEQFLLTRGVLHPEPGSDGPPLELRARAAAAQGHAIIAWWLETGGDESIETVASWTWQFCCDCLGVSGDQ